MGNNNISYEESLAEFNSGKQLKYRILEVKRHIRIKDDNDNLIWTDKIQYIGQRIVPSGWFSRKWETIDFEDEYGKQTYFDCVDDIIDWFKYTDGEQYNIVKIYSTAAKP